MRVLQDLRRSREPLRAGKTWSSGWMEQGRKTSCGRVRQGTAADLQGRRPALPVSRVERTAVEGTVPKTSSLLGS